MVHLGNFVASQKWLLLLTELKDLHKFCFLYCTHLMIGKEMKYRIKKARMPSVRIKCAANMAHSCTSIQTYIEWMRGPSCYMPWRASVHPFARSTFRK